MGRGLKKLQYTILLLSPEKNEHSPSAGESTRKRES